MADRADTTKKTARAFGLSIEARFYIGVLLLCLATIPLYRWSKDYQVTYSEALRDIEAGRSASVANRIDTIRSALSDHPDLSLRLANMLLTTEHSKTAGVLYEAGLTHSPGSLKYYKEYAGLLSSQGLHARALAVLDQAEARAITFDKDALSLQASLLLALKRPHDALTFLQKNKAVLGDEESIRAATAQALAAVGNYDDALDIYRDLKKRSLNRMLSLEYARVLTASAVDDARRQVAQTLAGTP